VYLRIGPPRIRVDPRLWRVAAGRRRGLPVSMLFQAEPPLQPAEVAAQRIREATADEFDRYGWSGMDRPPVPVPTVEPAVADVRMDFGYVDSQDRFRILLQVLAVRMDEAELHGFLLCATPLPPHLKLPLMPVNAMVAGIVLPSQMDAVGRPPTQNGWYVSESLTDQLLDYGLDWIGSSNGRVFVELFGRGRTRRHLTSVAEAIEQVRQNLYPATQVSVYAFNDAGYRRLTLSDHGHVNFEIAECDETWQPALHEQTNMLRQWAAEIRYGMVRHTQGPGPGWAITIGSMEPAPQIGASYYVIAPGLEDALVPDPYGLQLVTARHLAGIHVPHTWTLETLAPDRYLLAAPNPDEWFGLGRPTRATLSDARTIFADALMTDTDLARARHVADH
jgi:hypothetical protein